MNLSIQFDASALSEAFKKLPVETEKAIRETIKAELILVRDEAARTHNFKASTKNTLVKAIKTKVSNRGMTGEVLLDSGVAPYAASVHEGSKPHRIMAKNKKALYFVKGGRGVMVPKVPHKLPGWMIKSGMLGGGSKGNMIWSQKGFVDHPGTKKDPFLYEAFSKLTDRIVKNFTDAVNKSIAAAGLK